jgi:hypothetical protein
MSTLSVLTWIGNAAAVLCGPHGAVTAQATQAGCSRQAAYEHAQRVQQAVTDAQAGGPSRQQLLAAGERLLQENQQLWQALEQSVSFGEAHQRRFAATAAALGLSLNQTGALLGCVLPPADCPSRATVGRWVQEAARRATQVLAVLDSAGRPLVRELCLEEIFCHRLAILMGVEPHRLAWVLGQRGPDRSGVTWHQALQPWPDLEYVAADDGTGLQLGLAAIREDRRQAGTGPDLEINLDVFHTRREGHKALRRDWSEAEAVWERAERADRDLARTARRGQDRRSNTQRALRAWAEAEQALATACRREAAWQRAERALNLFRPDGARNDRCWAEAAIAAALPGLEGARWAKVRRMLTDPRALTFLDRLQRALATAEPRAELRAALAGLWRLRHASRPGCGPVPVGSCGVLAPVVEALICGQLAADWHRAYRRVAGVLSRVVRASSVVECLNSVVRMHQARHRTLSQRLLDLKRLYWNCREFADGKRKDYCPYEHLGLELPTYDWWELLHTEPERIRPKVSPVRIAA